MTDIHSHILPKMDDGSRSTEESLAMLAASAEQGIHTIAATSHFYPTENSPEQFLRRRRHAYERLREAIESDGREFPHILLGAEVYYFDGISVNDEVEALRIGDTPLLLLEMPFSPWAPRMVTEVKRLNERAGVTVLMAHIERYFRWQKADVWEELARHGVLMQSNAEFFLSWRTRHKALKMLRRGNIQFLGSDCHNMGSRRPRLGEAMEGIGAAERDALEERLRTFIP